MKLRFDVDALTNNPCVYSVTSNKLRLKIDFRILLFKEWKESNSISIIKQILDEHDITEDKIYPKYYHDIIARFKSAGFPVTTSAKEYEENFDIAGNNPLISSGLYNRLNDGRLDISDCFLAQLYSEYPAVSIEDGMKKAGLSILDVGYARMYRLTRYFNYYKEHPEEYRRIQRVQPLQPQEPANTNIVDDTIKETKNETRLEIIDHPYILYNEQSQPQLKNIFFNEAYHLVTLGIEKMFDIYSIQQKWLPIQDRMRTMSTLLSWIPTSERLEDNSELILVIQRKRLAALVKVVNLNFQDMKDAIGRMDITSKRLFFQKLQNLPRDPLGFYQTKRILSQLEIPRSTYYEILSNDSYGSSFVNRARQDDIDIEIIRTVKDYKGFEKGIRQIYMLMPKVAETQFSIHKIRRLMNKYGIRTTIRRPSRNRKAMKELIAKNRKANLLMRRFRLHRPNEVRLTDVTYLDYGSNKRAYGSATIDPVTGKLICFIISKRNDLQLALDTLEAMDAYPTKSNAILHSDQGSLYMTNEFQLAVIEKELMQSMSRRGNCWDNAPQESFFGHFKDESHYSDCQTLAELQVQIDKYSVYYNNERGMWDRGRMTPIEYEHYLQSMSEEEFSAYLAEEEKKFLETKEKAMLEAKMETKAYNELINKQLGAT